MPNSLVNADQKDPLTFRRVYGKYPLIETISTISQVHPQLGRSVCVQYPLNVAGAPLTT
jgi:hypothetical protein